MASATLRIGVPAAVTRSVAQRRFNLSSGASVVPPQLFASLRGNTNGRSQVAASCSMSSRAAAVGTAETSAPAAVDDGSVSGKTVIVTGANTGMGLVIAKELALKGAKVIMACRSPERGQAALSQVQQALNQQKAKQPGSATLEVLDLASLASVRRFAEKISSEHSHVERLICNAGIMIPPHSFTADGFESQFQVNHLSHYLLTRLLMPTLLSSPTRPSIIHVSSLASERIPIREGEFWQIAQCKPEDYVAMNAYRQSKLAQVLFTVETSRRFGEQVTVNSVHPGIVNTELFNRNMNPFVKMAVDSLGKLMESTGFVYSSEKGASTAIYLATNPVSVTSTGGYFADCAPKPANPVAFDRKIGEEWWVESAKAAGIDP